MRRFFQWLLGIDEMLRELKTLNETIKKVDEAPGTPIIVVKDRMTATKLSTPEGVRGVEEQYWKDPHVG